MDTVELCPIQNAKMLSTIEVTRTPSEIRSIFMLFISITATTLIIALGLVISTEISGYHIMNLIRPVDRATCRCDCWDGFFRGTYGRGGYKTFYFNYEKQMIIILGLLLFYSELLRKCLLQIFNYDPRLFPLFVPSIYSNFYGIWSIINYLNDHDYDRMLKSQLFFSFTELTASYLFLQGVCRKKISSWNINALGIISFLHIFLALSELDGGQFFRNFFLFCSDFLNFGWIFLVLKDEPRLRLNQRTFLISCSITVLLGLFYRWFCRFDE